MSTAPPAAPAARTVVVLGAGTVQGSGTLLTDRLVLTCAHVVKGGGRATVAHPRLPGHRAATVAWIDHDLDAALLLTADPVLPYAPVRLGVLHAEQALSGCEITGFPDIQRYGPDGRLEADQYTATALPMAGHLRGLLVCELDGPPPPGSDLEPPSLRGMSGGPVFAGNILIGIARQIPRQRGGRRVECVPLAPLVASQPFELVYRQTGTALRHERVHGRFPRDARYEEEYATALGAAYRRTKIFGLDELGRRDSEWDLDTAYLSLEAQQNHGRTELPPTRIDALLPDRPRVLLRGEAGAGKTTLLWWLAAHASAGTLGAALAPLNGLVPFVVPLRTLRAEGGTFPAPAQLPDAARLVTDAAPEGWVGRVLESGRALLLVDGLDEVPQEDREQAHQWLSRLLDRYPDIRCVATVRPLAVEPGWLDSQDFEELRLLPMEDRDIDAFVAAWHRAARLDDDDHETLGRLERDLVQQFAQNPALRDLARTPLLCAVICALHRRRQGLLPETRWSLYDSALTMLLGDRDKQRRIEAPEGITMNVEEQAQLLQRIAIWLVRGGQSELHRSAALRQLERALPGMERLRGQGSPEAILTHLLNRSGVLQERADDIYQFAHRTFQDFLAAKEFVEGDQLNELLGRAGSQQWYDVILLSAGHCGRREHPVLVNGLLDARPGPADTVTRDEITVLAALCAQHATWLDGTTRDRVNSAVAALFPPKDDGYVRLLARLGPAALAHLPDPAQVSGRGQAGLFIDLISEIGGAEAVPHARRWALAHPDHSHLFEAYWNRYPARAYAQQVLAACDLTHDALQIDAPEKLEALRDLPSATNLEIAGTLAAAELHAALRDGPWTGLAFLRNPCLTDLSFLTDCAEQLESLSLSDCPGVRDLGPLTGLPSLKAVELDMSHLPGSALATTASGALHSLWLSRLTAERLSQLPAHPELNTLTIEHAASLEVDSLDGWTNLRRLGLGTRTPVRPLLAALRRAPQVNHLTLPLSSATELTGEQPVPSLGSLDLYLDTDVLELEQIPRVFPSLERVVIVSPRHVDRIDISPIRAMPNCEVSAGPAAVAGDDPLH
ncbi:serine protease [Streptomyces sp. NBC_00439]|uniref:serine protease n=1 Tax=Streptomyces sp. NBC_00439 TaxID=2903650 RepID=UPI002256699B|nr:serine protease [Streptomyces sp. NBC_00439]MCX5101497.1 NACHT domain-containing protein [Streptomyces sp. NBC_00439]